MNTKSAYKISVLSALIIAVMACFTACTKGDSDGSPSVRPGDPKSSGINPDSAANGTLVTVTGTGLGDMRSIVFEKENVPAPFYSTLNTETSILFRIPDTAFGGEQNVIFTNSQGKQLILPFRVLAYPTVSSVSDYNFTEGTQITLTGTNLADVETVILTGTTNQATIVSKEKNTLVITMPATTSSIATLDITNATGKMTTTQEFVNIPQNFIAFDDDWGQAAAYGGSVQSWSFGCSAYGYDGMVKTGTKSLRVDYVDGGLSLFLGCNWGTPNLAFTDYYTAKYITFWARGEGSDVNITIVPDNPWPGNDMWGGPAATGSKTITINKDVWTYYKIPSSFINGGYSRLNFKIEGTTDKTVYYDNILLVK